MLCWSSRKEIPQAQGKRNPSKMVGATRGHQRADTLKPYSQKTSQSNHTRTTAFSNSMKLSHAHGPTQDRWIVVEWSTGGNGKAFQYPIILPFHTVHGVLKARILKWLAIPFSSGPHSVRPLQYDPPVLGCPVGMAWFH